MTGLQKRMGVLAGAALITMSLSSAFVHAQNSSGGPGSFGGRGGFGRHLGPGGPGGRGGFVPLFGQVKLTDAQREQAKSIRASHRDEVRAAAAKAFAAHTALRAAIASEQFDESAIRARSAEAAAADADMAVLNGRIYSEMWQILTPEQQKEVKAAEARREQRAAAGRQRRGGGATAK